MAEHSAVNRGVVGSSPTEAALILSLRIRYLACNNGWNKRSSNAPKNVGVRQIAERVFPQPSYDIRSLKFHKLKKMPAYVGIEIICVESRESKTRKPWLGKLPPPYGVGQRVAIWASGGTGRRTRLRIWRETVWVQFPPCPLRRNPRHWVGNFSRKRGIVRWAS